MDILNDIKRDLRIKTNSLDGEIKSLVKAATSDMSLAGINTEKKTETGEIDPLIYTAIKLYCKGTFGYDDKVDFQKAYENLKIALSTSLQYKNME